MRQKIKKHAIILLSMMLLFSANIFAQTVTVTGNVTDAKDKSPLPGVSILVKGTTLGVITDFDGNYSLTIPSANETLVFSFIGYNTKEVSTAGQTVINVALDPKLEQLEEFLVIGYGTVKKEDATGSVSAVSSEEFNKGAITSPQELLVGKTPGVVITTSSGAPGSGARIRVRGGSSLNASNDPLVIVDGVPIENKNVSGSSNFLSIVNPNDIETFTVLKDASATAIYGSRASNGVILITTKKGKSGKPLSVSYNLNTTVSTPMKYLDVYSGDEMRQIAYEHRDIYDLDDFSKLGLQNTDWQREIFRTTTSMDHNLSLTGSYKTLPYRVSVGYTDQNGILKNTGFKRLTGAVNLNPAFLDNTLKVNVNIKGMNTNHNFGDDGAVGSAMNMDPTQVVKDGNPNSAGYFQWPNYDASLGTPNPVEQALEVDNKSNVQRLIANAQIDYQLPFINGMRANLNLATDVTSSEGHNNRPVTTNPQLDGDYEGKINDFSARNTNNLLEFYLNYNKDLGANQNIDVTAGYSWQHFYRESNDSTRGRVPVSSLDYVDPSGNTTKTENYLVSFFGRVNYSVLNRYLLTLTIRDDGSSRFSEGNQWGLFPSAALAWKINEEAFLKDVNALSDLKLRLSWGKTGQQDIGSDYPAQAIYNQSAQTAYYMINGTYIPTLRPEAYDPNIKWEETTTQNIGLDFGFFNNRISGSVDVYKRVTDDLLNEVTIPTMSNFKNRLVTNVGSLENKGIEASLNGYIISSKDISWEMGVNLTYNRNKITKLLLNEDPNYIGILYGSGMTGTYQVTRVGYPGYSFFVNQQVYDEAGNPVEGLYVDLSGNGGTVNGDNEDKYIYKNPNPDYLIGFSTRLSYKNFDLSASARGSIGNYIYNQVAAGASYDQMYQIGYWKNMPKSLDNTNFIKRQFTSDYFVENGSYLKVDNISAGYKFDNIFKDVDARISFTVQNALTVTKYSGLDPEIEDGIDDNFYPRPRNFMLGINITF
ncbi:SusC/RagA family TonB-linked outer membrane protein [Saccharicrinis sp. FJH54]|uniref:SusC/RagA family TonB-linked outer membrane protein n=1 Tax=Saccharicrinis sp. FJH54 TaxID=3344665 RepID=UPI0035D465A9